jgi:hypothetical protein
VHGDPLVRRLSRTALVICAVAAAAAWAGWGGRMALGVAGGGLLIGISFVTLGSGVTALASLAAGGARPRAPLAQTLAKVTLRYALLGFLAYVMIARLRLHPIGLLVGASSIAAAASVEAARLLSRKP